MRRGVLLIMVPALLLVSNAVRGEEQYQLRMKPRGQGSETALECATRIRLSVVKWDSTGQQIADDLKVMKAKMAYEMTTLEMTSERDLRERRHYSRAVSSIDGGDEQPEPFDGKTLLFILKDGKQTVLTEKGEPLPEALVARLERQAAQWDSAKGRYEDMLPKKPVALGESWPIDALSWVKRDDIELQVVRAASQLKKVYQKAGRMYGVIETRVDIGIKSMTVAGRKLTMQAGSRITFRTSMDACLDGSSTECVEQGTYLFDAVVRAPGPDGTDTKMDQEIEIIHSQTTK